MSTEKKVLLEKGDLKKAFEILGTLPVDEILSSVITQQMFLLKECPLDEFSNFCGFLTRNLENQIQIVEKKRLNPDLEEKKGE